MLYELNVKSFLMPQAEVLNMTIILHVIKVNKDVRFNKLLKQLTVTQVTLAPSSGVI